MFEKCRCDLLMTFDLSPFLSFYRDLRADRSGLPGLPGADGPPVSTHSI